MKITQFEGTPEEFKAVASHIFGESTASEKEVLVSERVEETPTAESIEPKEAIREMLTRIPIPPGQQALYEALSGGQISYGELLERTGRTGQQMAGLLGALGRRINGTPEIKQAGLPGNVKAVLNYERIGGKRHMDLTIHAKEALEAEGVI